MKALASDRWVAVAVGFVVLVLANRSTAGGGCWTVIASDAARGVHSFGLRSDGTLWEWGVDHVSFALRTAPVEVGGMLDAVSFSGGGSHSLVVTRDGKLWAWGQNGEGQLGNGNRSPMSVPFEVTGLPPMATVSAGAEHSLAIAADGSLWSWGRQREGQIGRVNVPFDEPGQVPGLANVIAIAAGFYHSLAVTSDGSVWGFGNNNQGQLGIGPAPLRSMLPVHVASLTGVVSVAASGGGSSDNESSHALTATGVVWSWGNNVVGQLGDGTTTASNVPIAVFDRVTGFDADLLHSIAVRDDGSVWAWGDNTWGQLGDGSNIGSLLPNRVGTLPSAVAVSAGGGSSHAVLLDGTLRTWGANAFGQLGDCTTTDTNLPIEPDFPDGRRPVMIVCPPGYQPDCPADLSPDRAGRATGQAGCRPVEESAVTFHDRPAPGCAGSLVRTWEATDGCTIATCEQAIDPVDVTPPEVAAILTPIAPLPPRPALSPRVACSPPSSRAFRVECTRLSDACDSAPTRTAHLLVTVCDGSSGPPCPITERVAVSCDDVVELELVPRPCPRRHPRPPRPAQSVDSTGRRHVRGERVVLEAVATDACGNRALSSFDPSLEPAPGCEVVLADGTCCPAIATPSTRCSGP